MPRLNRGLETCQGQVWSVLEKECAGYDKTPAKGGCFAVEGQRLEGWPCLEGSSLQGNESTNVRLYSRQGPEKMLTNRADCAPASFNWGYISMRVLLIAGGWSSERDVSLQGTEGIVR